MIFIILLALAGIVISIYAYTVEMNISKNPEYKPACDISDKISCSRVMRSGYGKLFGISTGLFGGAFTQLCLCWPALAQPLSFFIFPLLP